MADKDNEPFSNPIAPANESTSHGSRSEPAANHHPLTNDDFRKLLMTPRAPAAGSLASVRSQVPQSVRGARKPVLKEDLNENKQKKKKFYAAIKKEDEDVLAELAKKYRDRAKERREGANPDYQSEDPMAIPAYRAVAPDVKSSYNAAERRRQMIEESKFLGGDMKHTHLVKGLDYALLQKVKAELDTKESDEEEEEAEAEVAKPAAKEVEVEEEDLYAIKSVMGNNIVKLISNSAVPQKNDLFLPGRMAYVVDLEDECADDIPTTVIRSKADCPNWDAVTSLSTNDIVINKLTQILSYLRHGGGTKKRKREKNFALPDIPKEKVPKKPEFDDSIYGDIGDYVPVLEKKDRHRERRDSDRKDKDKDKPKEKPHTYFEKPAYEDDYTTAKLKTKEDLQGKFQPASFANPTYEEAHLRNKLSSKLDRDVPESYAECYPGAPENDDAILDSDDEVDYSKMDMGNKKGTIGRWDFDTAEEYGEYMSNKEAMPKAAFQYGVKMVDGRKTRKFDKKKDEKMKLDRDLQKINALLAKRKPTDSDDRPNTSSFGRTPSLDVQNKRSKH